MQHQIAKSPYTKKQKYDNNLPLLFLLASILIGILISIYLYSGPDPFYDDAWYINLAHYILSGNFSQVIGNLFGYGFVNIFAIALSFKFFGYGDIQAILPSIIEYVLLLIVTYHISKKFYAPIFASATVYLLALAPFLVNYTTRVLPDINAGLAVALSFYAFLIAIDNKKFIWSITAGFLAAFPAYIKADETFIYIGLLAFLLIILFSKNIIYTIKRKDKRHINELKSIALIFAGLIIGLFAYFFIFYVFTNNFFFPIIYYTSIPSSEPVLSEIYILIIPFSTSKGLMNADYFPLGPILVLSIIGAAIGILKKNSKINYASFLCFGVFLYLLVGTSNIHEYIVINSLSRFFAIDASLFALLGGYALFNIYNFLNTKLEKKALFKIIYIFFIIITPLLYIPTYTYFKSYNLGITYSRETFNEAVNYIQGIAAKSQINVYTLAPVGFRYNTYYYFSFADGYNKNISTKMIRSDEKSNSSASCIINSPSNRSFIFVNISPDPQARSVENKVLDAWLDNNCSISEIYTIQNNYTLKRFSIYKVVPYR